MRTTTSLGSALRRAAALIAGAALLACGGGEPAPQPEPPKAPVLKTGKGVEGRTIRIGALNDESGPAAAIGKPYAAGKRLLAAVVNAGGSGILPDGWKVELVEKDHGYNPQNAVQAYNAIRDRILFIGTSFGTPNTLPLRPMLERDHVVAFPASLSSQMAENAWTPPLGPSYKLEAMRAMDFAVAHYGGADQVKAGIVYQQDDYGADGLAGWKEAAAALGVEVVAEQTVAPGQKDMAAVVTGLKAAGANAVLLTTLPSATGPILGTALQLGYSPIWIGNTPSWIDGFFSPEVIPPQVFEKFYWVQGLPYWGEKVRGMDAFEAAWNQHGASLADRPDFYILVSYIQGLVQLEAARRAIEQGDITRDGYVKALRSIKGWDAGGMIQPIDLSTFPYVTGTRTRILQPDLANRTWKEVAPYAEPTTWKRGG